MTLLTVLGIIVLIIIILAIITIASSSIDNNNDYTEEDYNLHRETAEFDQDLKMMRERYEDDEDSSDCDSEDWDD